MLGPSNIDDLPTPLVYPSGTFETLHPNHCADIRITFFAGLSTRAGSLTNTEVRKKRNELFEKEKAKQRERIVKIEKIKVEHKGIPEDCTLLMNKDLSTPFNCAMRKFLPFYFSRILQIFGSFPT